MIWWATMAGAAGFNYNDDEFQVNGNNNLNNTGCSRGMTPTAFQDNFIDGSWKRILIYMK